MPVALTAMAVGEYRPMCIIKNVTQQYRKYLLLTVSIAFLYIGQTTHRNETLR